MANGSSIFVDHNIYLKDTTQYFLTPEFYTTLSLGRHPKNCFYLLNNLAH